MEHYIKILRPKHWVKNILIFLPALLDSNYSLHTLYNLIIAFVCISAVASAGYIFNDIRDVNLDRQHPKKRYRPIASGELHPHKAFVLGIILIFMGTALSFIINKYAFLSILAYTLINQLYSIYLKKVRFIDIITLSTFYIIRLFYGAYASDVNLTGWFIATMCFAFLSISLHKRYSELSLVNAETLSGRDYSRSDLNQLQSYMLTTAFLALMFLNIHANFILTITSPAFFALLNLISVSIILIYFDNADSIQDDPVERILSNKKLILLSLILLSIYVYALI